MNPQENSWDAVTRPNIVVLVRSPAHRVAGGGGEGTNTTQRNTWLTDDTQIPLCAVLLTGQRGSRMWTRCSFLISALLSVGKKILSLSMYGAAVVEGVTKNPVTIVTGNTCQGYVDDIPLALIFQFTTFCFFKHFLLTVGKPVFRNRIQGPWIRIQGLKKRFKMFNKLKIFYFL